MSNNLADFLSSIFSHSQYEKKCDLDDHIVILGTLPDSYLISLINEIIDYKIKMSTSLIIHEGAKILIISENEPSDSLASLMNNITENETNSHEVFYIIGNIFSID